MKPKRQGNRNQKLRQTYEREAKSECFAEVQEMLYQVAQCFFPTTEAMCEAGQAFLKAYERYDKNRISRKTGKRKLFRDYAGEVTYYHCLERRREERRKQKQMNCMSPTDLKWATKSEIPVNASVRAYELLDKTEGDVHDMIKFVLKPPVSVEQKIKEYYGSFNDMLQMRHVWRKHIVVWFSRLGWKLGRIYKAMRDAGYVISMTIRGSIPSCIMAP